VTNKVLVIDDDPILLEIVKAGLSRDKLEVETVSEGTQGLLSFHIYRPDVVILDLMMPDLSGWEVYRSIRSFSDVPIIFLSALSQDSQVIDGLENGADDYITKPFSLKILQARVKAALRRARMRTQRGNHSNYDDGYLSIDLARRWVSVSGKFVRLSVREYDLLAYLIQNTGRVLSFQQILTNVWGDEYRDNCDYVHVYIWHLRKKLERDPKAPLYIRAERGFGYRFEKNSV
jgi:two-component system KDP operon response regulator KdpE